jgi:hypothetical protein
LLPQSAGDPKQHDLWSSQRNLKGNNNNRDSYRLNEMVMRDLGEKVMDDMSSNVMMDVVDQSIVPIERRQSSTQVTPFLIEQKTMWYQ